MAEIEKLPLTSMDIKEQQLLKLKELFPEVFTEGNKVDWDKLKLTLGEDIDTGKERFGMNWPGKADCFKTIQQPSIASLVPAREESIDFDSTQNLFIEGDNLEVLKLLQKSYLGKVKMIYIDPPYNTGNDFIYPDNYSENLQTYLEYTGQVDGEGRKFATNTETDGRFHSKWLNMMYPRLFLAKNLMKEDGVIFISIDDNEVHNLRFLCNEIFGEENFLSCIAWKKRSSPDARSTIGSIHDWILCYVKNWEQSKEAVKKMPLSEARISAYSNPDNDPRGSWASVDMTGMTGRATKDQFFKVTLPSGRIIGPPSGRSWGLAEATFHNLKADNRIWFGQNGDNVPRIKNFISESEGQVTPSLWDMDEVGSNDEASKEIADLFEVPKLFDTPKPTRLIKRMLHISTSKESNDIILDFFAGSASTAQAILELNKKDGGNRKLICVQLPHTVDEDSEAYVAGYKNIADISKERIRRVIHKLKQPQTVSTTKDKNQQTLALGLDLGTVAIGTAISAKEEHTQPLDLGFKVFKLSKSNFTIWDSSVEKTPEAIQAQLFGHIDHISPEAAQEAILYELLLKSGFELSTPIQKISFPKGEGLDGVVFSIEDGTMLICLEKQLTHELIKAMAELQPSRVICLDEGFQNNDQLKTNAVQMMKSKKVLKFQTV
jgi:adenine-specific DNA-methyltransferase